MALYIKNVSGVQKTWTGQVVEDGIYYEIQPLEQIRFSNDSSLLTDIGNGDALVATTGDGSGDITEVNMALGKLRNDDQQKDSEGAMLIRTKMAPTGWKYQMRIMEFETSILDSLYCKEHDDTDFPDKDIKFYNAAGTEITLQGTLDTDCVETRVDFEPQWDYELLAGRVEQVVAPGVDIRLWIVAVPDVPAANGGEIVFVSGLNFNYIGTNQEFIVDGRTPKLLTYNATFHTNKLQFKLRHPAGTKHKFMVSIEYYKP